MSSEHAITGIGALRACVDARGPTGGIRAMRCVARDFWRVDVSESPASASRDARIGQQYPLWMIIR